MLVVVMAAVAAWLAAARKSWNYRRTRVAPVAPGLCSPMAVVAAPASNFRLLFVMGLLASTDLPPVRLLPELLRPVAKALAGRGARRGL